METKYRQLFSPLQIGCLTLKNRIVMPAMGTNFADPEKQGFVSEKHLVHYMVKERVTARVITVQRITTPDLAEEILAEDAADLVAVGHAVTLVEKNARLGGTARMAAVLKERREFFTIVRNLERQLAALPVRVELNRAVDAAGIRENDYDAIIVATGAMPVMPHRFEASGDPCEVLTFREVLSEPNRSFVRATVVGGGSVGVEVALHLAENGADVTIVEVATDICRDLGPLNRTWMKDATANRSIHVMTETQFVRLGPEGLVLKKGAEEIVEPAPAALVVAIGSTPAPLLFPAGWPHVHYVGDCVRVGNAMDAIHSAYHTAMEVAC